MNPLLSIIILSHQVSLSCCLLSVLWDGVTLTPPTLPRYDPCCPSSATPTSPNSTCLLSCYRTCSVCSLTLTNSRALGTPHTTMSSDRNPWSLTEMLPLRSTSWSPSRWPRPRTPSRWTSKSWRLLFLSDQRGSQERDHRPGIIAQVTWSCTMRIKSWIRSLWRASSNWVNSGRLWKSVPSCLSWLFISCNIIVYSKTRFCFMFVF